VASQGYKIILTRYMKKVNIMALTPAQKMRKQRLKNPKLRIHAIDLDPADPLQQRLHAGWQAEPNKKQLFIALYTAHLQRS
jgi:hypothetical protein